MVAVSSVLKISLQSALSRLSRHHRSPKRFRQVGTCHNHLDLHILKEKRKLAPNVRPHSSILIKTDRGSLAAVCSCIVLLHSNNFCHIAQFLFFHSSRSFSKIYINSTTLTAFQSYAPLLLRP